MAKYSNILCRPFRDWNIPLALSLHHLLRTFRYSRHIISYCVLTKLTCSRVSQLTLLVSDSSCGSCRVGDYMMCEEDINGILRHGGYAEYVTLRTEAVAAVPDGMDPAEVASLLCAGVTMFNGLRNMSCQPPDYVAVQGIGGLGHLGIQFSKAMGFRTIALSSSPAKEELSKALGADVYIDGSKVNQTEALQQLGGAKLNMCIAPNPEIIRALVPALAISGELCILALTGEAPINLGALVTKRLSIRGWPSGVATDSEDCMQFVKAHGLKVMVQHFSLDKANDAYNHRSTARFRAVIIP